MKVAMFFANGFEEIEALSVIDLLRRAQVDTTIVSIGKELEIKGGQDIKIAAESKIEDINFENLDMIILPGGLEGVSNLEKSTLLMENLIKFNKENKYIAAICAAPTILSKLKILDNKSATCYPSFENDLLNANIKPNSVVVDNNIVTSKGIGTTFDFALKLIEIIKNKDAANKIASETLINYS